MNRGSDGRLVSAVRVGEVELVEEILHVKPDTGVFRKAIGGSDVDTSVVW